MATHAQLRAEFSALLKKYETDKSLMLSYILPGALAAGLTDADLNAIASGDNAGLSRRAYIPISIARGRLSPAEAKAYEAALAQVGADVAQIVAVERQLSHEGINLEPWQVALIAAAGILLAPAAAGAAAGGSAGAAGAAAGAGSGAAATGATAAELGTTAAAASTPIVVAGSTAAGAATATAAAGAAASTIASKVGSAVTSATGSTAAGAVASSVVSDVSGAVSGIEAFIKPVTDFASGVLQDIQAIDKNYIIPFTQAIQTDYNTVNGLIGTVQSLAHSGIQGILAIPSAIGAALSSIDASNQRLVAMQEEANANIAKATLVPGIGGAIAAPLADIHAALKDAFNQPVPTATELSSVKLNETLTNLSEVAGAMDNWAAALSKLPVVGPVVAYVMQGINTLLASVGAAEHLISLVSQTGWEQNPVAPLDPATAVRAWWRGQLSELDARTEIQRHGIDQTRQTLLHDLEQWLPGTREAARMFYKGILSSEQVAAALGKQGLSAGDVQAILDELPDRVEPREAVSLSGRSDALAGGFLSESLGSAPPDAIKTLYPPKFLDAARAPLDWLAHWNLADVRWWARAAYRGVATPEEFKLACKALNFPKEMTDNLLFMEQETIQLWMVPDMIASGILTEADGLSYLEYIGIAPRDAALIMKYGLAKGAAAHGVTAQGLSNVSLGVAAEMYVQGIINGSEYVEILEAHGLSPEAAALTLKLTDQKNALAERRANAQALVKEVDAGIINIAQLQSTLYKGGYTAQEVNTYTAESERNALAKSKNPSEAQVEKFWKAALLDTNGAIAALQLDGWSFQWARAFLTLWGANDVPASQP